MFGIFADMAVVGVADLAFCCALVVGLFAVKLSAVIVREADTGINAFAVMRGAVAAGISAQEMTGRA